MWHIYDQVNNLDSMRNPGVIIFKAKIYYFFLKLKINKSKIILNKDTPIDEDDQILGL